MEEKEGSAKRTVLFVCTGNSARSQMAEGLLRSMHGDRYEVHSAGVLPARVSRHAIRVMGEIGVDISGHRSKHVDEFVDMEIDYLVTLCGHAASVCPDIPRARFRIDRPTEDPFLTDDTDEGFRRVRDDLREFIGSAFGGDDDE
ncbi:MAG: arsenate reductase ArsC [Thermoplasmata archaeon]|nr:arsenate reductase ArsC [Thermoplasmata archaeon]